MGTGEFLDTWLLLLERLTNPENTLLSPYSLLAKTSPQHPFTPPTFLIMIQRLVFEVVMKLWNHSILTSQHLRISESVLVILCSILKGEAIIADRKAKDIQATTPGASGYRK